MKINNLSFEEINIGDEYSFKKVITDKEMKQFLELTNDINPLHNDKEYAINEGFENKVVYGQLLQSFFSTLAGVYIPGVPSLILTIETRFKKPSYVGDEITIKGKVTKKTSYGKIIDLEVKITNSKNTLVEGHMKVCVRK